MTTYTEKHICTECKKAIVDLLYERMQSFRQQRKKDVFVNDDKLKIRANELKRLVKIIENKD